MKINKKQLQAAVENNILSQAQADALFDFLKRQPSVGVSFDFTHVLYYVGGLMAIGAMTIFMTLGWEALGGGGIFFIALTYAGIGLKLTGLFQKKGYAIPAGICATFVVALTPLALYGLLEAVGGWPAESTYREYHQYLHGRWLVMEAGTLVVGILLVWHYKYPFLMMPIAATLWYLSMDITALFAGGRPNFELRALVSMYFGLGMILLAFGLDLKLKNTADYAFWLYLFGIIAFWGGMTAQYADSELSKLIYFSINLLMIGFGVLLVRRAFVVFGAIGSSLYLGYLASDVFRDSWLFPVALTAMGLGIISLGVFWQRNEQAIAKKTRRLLPPPFRVFLDSKDT